MKILFLATTLLLAATGVTYAQNVFALQSNGTTVGRCTYSFDKSKGGYKIVSHYDAKLPNRSATTPEAEMAYANNITMNEVQQVHTYKLDETYSYLGGTIFDNIIERTSGFSPNKDRTSILLTMVMAGAASTPKQLALMPGLFVLPLYDAGAVQGLLDLAINHPTPDNHYFLIIGGSSVQSHWTTQPDATGTLAGKPVTLHHYSFAFGKHIYNVYADDTNTLMETDISGLHISYVRNGFALDASAAPAAK